MALRVLFAIIFAETGLVVTPVPAGRLAALRRRRRRRQPGLADQPRLICVLLIVAAIAGRRGQLRHRLRTSGPRSSRARTRGCSTRSTCSRPTSSTRSYGGKTIILARFMPDRPHVRPVRGRDRQDELPPVRPLQRHRRQSPGSSSSCSAAGGSAGWRSCRRTSSWSSWPSS